MENKQTAVNWLFDKLFEENPNGELKYHLAIFKFNSGNLALLCSNCYKIIKVGYEFTEDELKSAKGEKDIKPQYCENCNENGK